LEAEVEQGLELEGGLITALNQILLPRLVELRVLQLFLDDMLASLLTLILHIHQKLIKPLGVLILQKAIDVLVRLPRIQDELHDHVLLLSDLRLLLQFRRVEGQDEGYGGVDSVGLAEGLEVGMDGSDLAGERLRPYTIIITALLIQIQVPQQASISIKLLL